MSTLLMSLQACHVWDDTTDSHLRCPLHWQSKLKLASRSSEQVTPSRGFAGAVRITWRTMHDHVTLNKGEW